MSVIEQFVLDNSHALSEVGGCKHCVVPKLVSLEWMVDLAERHVIELFTMLNNSGWVFTTWRDKKGRPEPYSVGAAKEFYLHRNATSFNAAYFRCLLKAPIELTRTCLSFLIDHPQCVQLMSARSRFQVNQNFMVESIVHRVLAIGSASRQLPSLARQPITNRRCRTLQRQMCIWRY